MPKSSSQARPEPAQPYQASPREKSRLELEGRAAALIANHGMVAVAPRPDKALHVTALVERTAQIVWGARALGEPIPLPGDVNAGFAGIYAYLRANPA
jgi:L-fuculose-phosphate aldolase